jgi:hypothetical protein
MAVDLIHELTGWIAIIRFGFDAELITPVTDPAGT